MTLDLDGKREKTKSECAEAQRSVLMSVLSLRSYLEVELKFQSVL